MKHALLALPFIVSALLTTPTAYGQTLSPAAQVVAPSFATLDRQDASSKVNVTGGMSFLDQDDALQLFHFDAHVQYVFEQGSGVYATLSMNRVNSDVVGFSQSAMGNPELGLLHNRTVAKNTLLTVRGGLSLPSWGTFDEALVNVINTLPRTTDVLTTIPKTTVARLSASVSRRQHRFFFRADVGIDIPVKTPMGIDVFTQLRLNVGAGLNAGPFSFTGEFVTVASTKDLEPGDSRFLQTAALSAAVTGDTGLRPSISVVLPVNQSLRTILDAAVIVGVQRQLR